MSEQKDINILKQCLAFQGNLLDLAHPSRVEELMAPFAPKIVRNCPAAWQRVADLAAREWNLQPQNANIQDSPALPFILMPLEQTRIMADWLGVLAAFPKIKKNVKGQVIRDLHQNLPHCFPAVYRQVLNFKTWADILRQAWNVQNQLTPQNIADTGALILQDIIRRLTSDNVAGIWMLRFPKQDWMAQVKEKHWWGEPQEGLSLLREFVKRGLVTC